MAKKTGRLAIFLLLSPFFAALVYAGAPAGALESLDPEIRDKVIQNLAGEGYMAHFANGQDVQRGVSAYLWDNRQILKNVRFHNARQVDVLICVMIRKGYGNFSEYDSDTNFMSWCEQMLE